ncbi:Hypothetical protein SMAX5B_003465 [Scophthalmus maximus]|uniref:Uncharacterized protein n=1 Tax=Scophthalmus maximus TaxID=52904 RepID=A0A2U9CKP0_SCOMX|nr:Hypothetical protein SMAX5B_003465 [Scophthalmus maximus]KAF0044601.1 hypothetical protein F2P81_003759 [Scophthalmus maximus]
MCKSGLEYAGESFSKIVRGSSRGCKMQAEGSVLRSGIRECRRDNRCDRERREERGGDCSERNVKEINKDRAAK